MTQSLHIASIAWVDRGFVGGRLVELAVLAAMFMMLLAMTNRLMRLHGPLRKARSAMLADLYEIRLYWRRAWLILRAQVKLASHVALYLLLISPSIAIGAGAYLATKDLLVNRYAFAPAEAGREVAVCLSGLSAETPGGRPLSVHEKDAMVTARVVVPSAQKEWIRLQPSRSGSVEIGLPDQGSSFLVNFGDSTSPARPLQQVGDTQVRIDYPPYKLWGMSSGYLLYMLVVGLCFAWPASAIVGGKRKSGAAA